MIFGSTTDIPQDSSMTSSGEKESPPKESIGNGDSCFGGLFGNSAIWPAPLAPALGWGVIREFIETIDPDLPRLPSSSLSNMNAMIFLARSTREADNRVVLTPPSAFCPY